MNIYSVLDDSDEENVAQKKPSTSKASPGEKKKGGTASSAPAGRGKAESKSGKGENAAPSNTAPGGKGKDNTRSPKTPSSAAADTDDAVGTGKDNNRGGKPRGKEPHRRGERRGNGDGDDSAHRRPKREFDRRSGTGRGKEVAKGGRGSYGAGNVNQDAMDAEKHPGEAEVLLEPKGDVDAGATDDADEEVEPAEPEPVTYTLDEFMEKRNEARKEALQLLGADKRPARTLDSDFAGMKSVDGGEIDNYMPARNAKSADIARKDQRSTSKAKVLDVGFRFESNNYGSDRTDRSGRGGRGGEGRGRGSGGGRGDRGGGRASGRGRGGGRGGAPANVFNNAVDFPSL